MSSEALHENAGTLGPEGIDQHRAIVSLMEELEAVDWYNQRAKATMDEAGVDAEEGGPSSDGSLAIGSLRSVKAEDSK